MKKYTVYKRFSIEVSREVLAESIGEAASKVENLYVTKFVKTLPGVELVDWDKLSGMTVCEERE